MKDPFLPGWLDNTDRWYYSHIESKPAWAITVLSAPSDAGVSYDSPGAVRLRVQPRWRNTRVVDAEGRDRGTIRSEGILRGLRFVMRREGAVVWVMRVRSIVRKRHRLASAAAFLARSNASSKHGPKSTMRNCCRTGRSCNPAGLRSRLTRCGRGATGMSHAIHRVEHFEIVGPYTLALRFTDGSAQRIDFRPVLEGEVFAPLQDLHMFNSVELETVFGTVA